jgi:hypothetical protein
MAHQAVRSLHAHLKKGGCTLDEDEAFAKTVT